MTEVMQALIKEKPSVKKRGFKQWDIKEGNIYLIGGVYRCVCNEYIRRRLNDNRPHMYNITVRYNICIGRTYSRNIYLQAIAGIKG